MPEMPLRPPLPASRKLPRPCQAEESRPRLDRRRGRDAEQGLAPGAAGQPGAVGPVPVSSTTACRRRSDILPQLYREPAPDRGRPSRPVQVTRKKVTYRRDAAFPLRAVRPGGQPAPQRFAAGHLPPPLARPTQHQGPVRGLGQEHPQRRLPRDEVLEPRLHLHVRASPTRRRARCSPSSHLSNNHILCADDKMSRRILKRPPRRPGLFQGLPGDLQPAGQPVLPRQQHRARRHRRRGVRNGLSSPSSRCSSGPTRSGGPSSPWPSWPAACFSSCCLLA